jgi:hypothetical protein
MPNPELTLLSEGAELVMLENETFLKKANRLVIDNIRKLTRSYPESNEIQEKFQREVDWTFYKNNLPEIKRFSSAKSSRFGK